MRAWQYVEHGPPSKVLRLADVEPPVPGPGQVLVEVDAAAVNFADGLVVRGTYQSSPPLPAIAGMEVTGRVVAVGDGVGLEPGVRVCGMTPRQSGAFAELAVLDAGDAWVSPEGYTAAQAAGFATAYQTAWFAVHVRGRVAPGEAVVVHAAAGGVGVAAVQLAAAAGARVVGVVGSPAKVEVAMAAGCSDVVLRADADAVNRIKGATRGGAHVVIDPVGGGSHTISERVTRFDGRIVVLGFASGVVPRVRADLVMVKNISVVGLHWGLYRTQAPDVVAEQYALLRTEVARRGIVPAVSSVMPMERLPDALEAVESGRSHGRVVVEVRSREPRSDGEEEKRKRLGLPRGTAVDRPYL
ncbi:zinc-binding dehydrogenase [Nocardioides caldifontis]|uniref:zinc-binding dehydrogenase n=1 Tax=Nocardioides caldifontis TaxID=2588938 RepID=UPI0011DF20EB|nr:zinc-binding dehydrogenase [Nocardioides caldifontis]